MISQQKPAITYGWLRAVLALIFFILLYVLLILGFNSIYKQLAGHNFRSDSSQGALLLAALIINGCFFLTAYLFRKFIDRKSFMSEGFRWSSAYARTGLFTALFVIVGGTAFLLLFGYLHFTVVTFTLYPFLINIFIFILVAFGEEIFFRGYLLNNLMQNMHKWVALIISAIFFMLMHLDNPGAAITFLPVLSVFIGGILFGINYIYTKNLWFGICLHFLWNFLQGPVLSYDVSGTPVTGIFKHSLSGSSFITGGVFGFEGSAVCVCLSVVSIITLVAFYERKMQQQFTGNR